MGKIVYLSLAAGLLDNKLLGVCSTHSPLVEPLGEKDLLLDLTPFNRIAEILGMLTAAISEADRGQASIGLAASPLLAMLAVNRRSWDNQSRSCCQFLSPNGVAIIHVIPGREALFMSSLPLEEFPPLSAREVKKLKRLGYNLAGDLAALGSARLQQIIKRDASALWQNSQGRDYRPVKGLYPPGRLGYSLIMESGSNDHQQLNLFLKQAARELGAMLEQRHAGCREVILQLEFNHGTNLEQERKLAFACHDSGRLGLILQALLPTAIEEPVTSLRVFLTGLQPVEMKTQDLFTFRYDHREENLKRCLEQLLQLGDGSIKLGTTVERREKVLAFWDPWRFPPEVDKHETLFTTSG